MNKEADLAPARLEVVHALAEVEAAQWDELAGGQPFVRHAFLQALETTGCVSEARGWLPWHLILRKADKRCAALPLYLKHHSRGEFVFDSSWAEAYVRRGGRYYPKLLTAVPFTPVTGRRLLGAPEDRQALIEAALNLVRELGVSSWHCLFPTEGEAHALARAGLLLRRGVQFHWHNAGYGSFEDFLAELARNPRKKIRQERRRVREAGVDFQWRSGAEITEADWRFFERCYRNTYREHGSMPYLNLDFFLELGRRLGDHCLLIIAHQHGVPIASALNLFDDQALYGRYWGSLRFVSGLHFETCYYQGIEFCIARGLSRFEGGAQGEHKLARGLVPVTTWSAHWIADAGLREAVARFLAQETEVLADYVATLNEHTPLRSLASRLRGNDGEMRE
ncbi:GNAT family N-acetyltransferase [Thiobacter aerophilum]|uniref:GNAT family N-acetyltransferase n=1 Tax=Thiobacter aerophilum TaxID=3121275 RepID=A0ABV0EDS4_9BURK